MTKTPQEIGIMLAESILEKRANFGRALGKAVIGTEGMSVRNWIRGAGRNLYEASQGAVPVAAMLTATGIGAAVMAARNDMTVQNRFNKSLARVVATNPIVGNADPTRVQELAQSVFNIAPNAVGDPNILSSVLANIIHGQGLDPRTARDLMDLEEKYHNIRMLASPGYSEIARLTHKPMSGSEMQRMQHDRRMHAMQATELGQTIQLNANRLSNPAP